MIPKYVDVHCHPNLAGLKENQDEVIATMAEEGVLGVVVGTNLESSREAVALAHKHEHLFATVGLHPNYTQKEEFDRRAFAELLEQPKVVGVGECGIDYFRQSTTTAGEVGGEGWKEKQWEVFRQHADLALEHDKPLMVHCRPSKGSMDAYEEVADYLEFMPHQNVQHSSVEQGRGTQEVVQYPDSAQADIARGRKGVERVERAVPRGNMHFFVGSLDVARRFWSLGFTTSFTGVLTFTKEYDEVVREAPLDMLLTETDAPWAAPVPHRGEVNQPVYVRHVLDAVARIKGISPDEASRAILQNAERVFGISLGARVA